MAADPPRTDSPRAHRGAGGGGFLPDRRITLALDVSSVIVLLVMGALGLTGLPSVWSMITAAALCIAYGAIDLLTTRTGLGRRHAVAGILLQTLVVVALLALHTRYQDTFAFLFVMLSIRTVVTLGPRIGAVMIALFWVLSSAAAFWTHGREGWFNTVFNLGVYPLCGMVGYALLALSRSTRERAEALTELRRAQSRLHRLAVDEERRRLGRDLHDSVKQQVFAASMQLAAARSLLPGQPESALAAVGRAEQATRQAVIELNAAIHELRSAELGAGLDNGLRQLTRSWAEQSRLAIDCSTDPAVDLPADRQQAVLRVAQEALANIARHARASRVRVCVQQWPDAVELVITDNGRGFDPARVGPGVGMNSMEERATHLGGNLQVRSTPGSGTTVRLRLPEGSPS